MCKILQIIASPRGVHSKSAALSHTYLEILKEKDKNISVDAIELWKEKLPEFDANRAAAKMTFFGDGEMNESKKSAWDTVLQITQRFLDADHYVFAIPMWNGGIPYKMKQYIDIITQPGLLFGFDPENGYSGLLKGKKATLFYTSGVYAPGAAPKYGSDYHSNYFHWWLNMIGITAIEELRFQPSLLTEDPIKDFEAALLRTKELAYSKDV
ncbi:FMN-dependent NADH-azoreductase [Spongiimicrobium salis]|uniref:FMN-dependent NADH-azoreductase n=1 Tax=Spongiimicrobium salis TaxID=1667022 RepID=UPI00374D20C4